MKSPITALIMALVLVAPSALADDALNHAWVMEDLLSSQARPFAIGHRGFGANLGEIPDSPIENTVEAVVAGFEAGAHFVEIDVQLTADGRAIVFHDDFLGDLTCINTLTVEELQELRPEIPRLHIVLKKARKYARTMREEGSTPTGLVDIEIKTPSPLCDPWDETEAELVQAVIADVRKANMSEQVMIESFSPAIVALVANMAPDLLRAVSSSVLQFLPPEQVEAATGLEVTPIDKDAGLGLQWYEIGPFFRLPAYIAVEEYVGVLLALGARALSLDVIMLDQAEQTAPGSGAALVASLKGLGFSVWGYTVADAQGWYFLEMLGVEGIFIDDVPLGVALQAPF